MTSLYARVARAGPSEQRKEFVQRVKTLLGRKSAKLGDSRNDDKGGLIFAARIRNMPDQQGKNITATILLRWRG